MINVDKITEADIAKAIAMGDSDDACAYLQDIAGITDGGVAGVCFSDIHFDWVRDIADRERMVREWLKVEGVYAPKMVDALYNPQWGRMVQVDAEFHEMMTDHFFEAWHSGGGCMAWRRDLTDGTESAGMEWSKYMLITNEEMSLEGEERDPVWIVGRYLDTEDGDTLWYCVSDVDVALALEIAGKLPVPTEQYTVSLPDSDFA